MPQDAWSNFAELRSYEDCSAAALGISDLGTSNVTLPDWKTKELRRAYYAAVSYADSEVGRVLDQLDSLGLAESTVVVVWSDHGWQLGEHAEWAKHTNFELAARVPLLLSVPGSVQGQRSGRLVELVDLFPTLVEAAGLPALPACPALAAPALCTEGLSLLPLLADPDTQDWKEAVFWQYGRGGLHPGTNIHRRMGYSLRTARYRYTEWVPLLLDQTSYTADWDKVRAAELYDLQMDPGENTNLASHPHYTSAARQLSTRLRAGWRAALPKQDWRQLADQRIERTRKSGLTVRPAVGGAGLRLAVTQTSHAFPFGTKLKASLVRECVEAGRDSQFCLFARQHFNYVVAGNAMKWSYNEWREGKYRF